MKRCARISMDVDRVASCTTSRYLVVHPLETQLDSIGRVSRGLELRYTIICIGLWLGPSITLAGTFARPGTSPLGGGVSPGLLFPGVPFRGVRLLLVASVRTYGAVCKRPD